MKRTCTSAARRAAHAARRGFTLIELLAVIAIISILAIFLLPKIPEAFNAAKVAACQKNLSEIYGGLMLYETQYKRIPEQSGARFFTCLISREVWENTANSAKRLTCPGVDIGALEIGTLEPEEWYISADTVTGASTSYAGRDLKNHPLRRLKSGKEILVADDNDPMLNHLTETNALFGDGAVTQYMLPLLREQGVVSADQDVLLVGHDSPVPDLRKLSLD